LIENNWLVLVLIVVFSGLLVAGIPMFSLKFKNLDWGKNQLQYIFLIVCILLLAFLGLDAFAPIIIWYILLSVTTALFKK